jgi:anti-sigma factor (TIGR02949 family)
MTEKQIDCEQALKQLYVYLDRELGEADHAAMQEHLHTCKSCFSRIEFERRLKDKLGALRGADATPGVRDRIKGLLKSL